MSSVTLHPSLMKLCYVAACAVLSASTLRADSLLDQRPRGERHAKADALYHGPKSDAGPSFWWMGTARHNCRLIAVGEEMVTIESNEGRFEAPWQSLPFDVRNRLSAAYNQKKEEAERRRVEFQRALAGIETVNGKILSVTSDGVIISRGDQTVFVRMDPANRVDGESISVNARVEGVYKYTTALGAQATVRAYRVIVASR